MRPSLCNAASELAIRATLYLALQPPGKLSTIRKIARKTGLAEPYLAKIIQRLTSAGLVRAFRGPGGGIELGRAPDTINLSAIVRAIEGPPQPEWCVLGLQDCSEENPCPLHARWAFIRGEMQHLLEETTLASLASGLREVTDLADRSWVRFRADAARVTSEGKERRNSS